MSNTKKLNASNIAVSPMYFLGKVIWSAIRLFFMLEMAFIILYPIIYMLSMAFRDSADMWDLSIVWIPKNFTLENFELVFESLGDRAQIYINDTLAGIAYINDSLQITINARKGDILTVLCENMGRANFGSKMMRKKGIAGRLLIDDKIHFDWQVYTLPMDNTDKVVYTDSVPEEKSVFYSGKFFVDEPADTFVKLDNFTKGFVVVNGFNLGRYWEIGPQQTLYLPASLLKKGENDITVFESDGIKGEPEVEFCDKPILG